MTSPKNDNKAVGAIALTSSSVIALSVLGFPYPDTLVTVTWALIGFSFARAFGKQLDQLIKSQPNFIKLGTVSQWFIGSSLDFIHHFWIGLLLMTRFEPSTITMLYGFKVSLYYFGWGIFIDDLPDIPERFKGYFKYLMKGD